MIRRQKRGSLAIFFCLIMTADLLILGTLLQAARLRAAENDLNRAMSAQIQASLAAYDRSWRQFGLFGFKAAAADRSVFTDSLPAGLQSCPVQLEAQSPLSDVLVLNGQITRYMKARLPAVYLELLASRLAGYGSAVNGSIQKGAPDQIPDQIPAKIPARLPAQITARLPAPIPAPKTAALLAAPGNNMPATAAPDGLTALLSSAFGNLQADDIRNVADSLFGGIVYKLKDKALQQIQEFYRQYANELLGIESADPINNLLGQMPDFLDPASITRFARHLEILLDFKTAPVYEKCCLVEYILGQFRPAVEQNRAAGSKKLLKTLDGRLFSSLPDSRQAEVEQILTGFGKPGSARMAMQVVLTSLRSLIQLAALLCDQQRMSALQAAAGGTAAAVAALTGGTVVIDPEIMVYLMAAGQAIGAGFADCGKLMAGQAVNIWPGKSQVNIGLYYQDYLRLFLYTIPRATLLKRTGRQLSQILPGSCFTRLLVKTEFRKRTYQLSGGYH